MVPKSTAFRKMKKLFGTDLLRGLVGNLCFGYHLLCASGQVLGVEQLAEVKNYSFFSLISLLESGFE